MTADPYAVWLSEIMLQQTTVVAVKPYYEKFLRLWPTVRHLAAADSADVMAAWAGLGYYARARNLHKCAQVVTAQYNGLFPDTEAALLNLPGVGPYTAAAIAAIAFNRRAVVVDGNVERVMARVFAVTDPLPKSKAQLKALADQLTPHKRAGDYAQAVMDLGATVCTPKSPSCALCPWSASCQAKAQDIAATLPRKLAKKAVPTRHGVAYCALTKNRQVMLVRRPPKGLLGGMLAFPVSDWRTSPWTPATAKAHAPLKARWTALPDVVEHTFTHFHLRQTILVARVTAAQARRLVAAQGVGLDGLMAAGLPNVMQKVARALLGSLSKPSAKPDKRRRAL